VSGATRGTNGWADRFPDFDVLSQAQHWDQVTAEAVLARTGPAAAVKFFTEPEESCARALLNLLTGQDERDGELAVPVLEMVDSRLAAGETDGWRYAGMPEDGQAWRDTLAHLDGDAYQRHGTPFADAPEADQAALVQAVQDLKSADWHGLPAAHVWSLWTRYAIRSRGPRSASPARPTHAATRTPGSASSSRSRWPTRGHPRTRSGRAPDGFAG
jgi:hypothetical protein